MVNRIGGVARHLLGAVLVASGVMAADAAVPPAVLTPLTVTGVDGAAPLAVSFDGQQAYVGSSTTGDLSIFNRDATGSYVSPQTYSAATLLGTSDAELLQALAVSRDDNYVYAAYEVSDLSASSIEVLKRNANGSVTKVQSFALPGSRRIGALAVSPDDMAVYATEQDSLLVFDRNPTDGRVSLHQRLDDNVGGVDGLAGAWAVAVSADSHYIYVSGADEQAVAVFSRDAGGALAFEAVYKNGVNGVSGLADARGVVISSDGNEVYVAGHGDNAVSAFTRDAATGLLQPSQVYLDGMSGITGLFGAFALALSLDGSQLYVLGSGEDALTVMRRDGSDGTLSQTAVLRQGQGLPAVNGLSAAFGIATTPDAKQLLVSSPLDNSLASFKVATADLALEMQTDAIPVTADNAVPFQLTVTNNGPDDASGVEIADQLFAGIGAASGVFGTNQACTLVIAQLQCAIGDLAVGQQTIIDINVTYPSPGRYINDVVAVVAQRDPQLGNNHTQATVQIDPSQNKGPVATADQATTLPGIAVDIAVLDNDYDLDGSDYSLTALDTTSQQGGSLSINGDGVHYVPPSPFHGIDSFTYTITDTNGLSTQGTVQVTVNTPPVAHDDVASVTGETTSDIYVLVNDTDADGDPLGVVGAQTPSTQGGTVDANTNGTVSYSPPPGFSGQDIFSYTIGDGYGGMSTAQVSVNVTAAAAPAASASGDTPAPVTASSSVGGGGSMRIVDALILILFLLARSRRYT